MGGDDAIDEERVTLCCALCCANCGFYGTEDCCGCSGKGGLCCLNCYVTSIACIQGCGIPTRRQKKNFINLNRILNESGSVSDALLRWMTST
eukprot:scaffold8263_cov128-Skeletonema_menzelii.AAC.2